MFKYHIINLQGDETALELKDKRLVINSATTTEKVFSMPIKAVEVAMGESFEKSFTVEIITEHYKEHKIPLHSNFLFILTENEK